MKQANNLLINEDEWEDKDNKEVVMEPQGDEELLELTEDEVTYEDHDFPNSVVRRSMLTLKVSKSDWRRNNILKT